MKMRELNSITRFNFGCEDIAGALKISPGGREPLRAAWASNAEVRPEAIPP
jgi:hypothetical protein